MKKIKITASLMALLCALPLSAAEDFERGKKEYMGACGEADRGRVYTITNTSVLNSCDSTDDVGTLTAVCGCLSDGEGGYAWASVVLDSSAFTLLAGDADGQTIQGQTGSNKARVIIDEGDYADSVRIVGPGADPAYISIQGAQLDLYPPGNNGSISATSSALSFALGDGYWLQNSDGTIEFQVTGFRIVSTQAPPSSSAEACTSGDFIPSTNYLYYCVAATWKRVAISTFGE